MGDSLAHLRGFAATLSPVDWVIVFSLAVSTVLAFLRGLIRSLLSLAGLFLGVVAAGWYATRVAAYLLRWTSSPVVARVLAYVLILVAVYLAAALLGRVLRGAAGVVGLGFVDRLAGALFGLLRGVLLWSALLVPFSGYLPPQGSVLLPYLLPAAHAISFVVPRDFEDRMTGHDWKQHAGRLHRDVE